MSQLLPLLTEDDKRLIQDYVRWLQQIHRTITLEEGIAESSALPPMPLEMVYALLRSDRASAYERGQSLALLEKEWRRQEELEARRVLEQMLMLGQMTPEQVRSVRYRLLAEAPYMPTLEERDRLRGPDAAPEHTLTLGEAYQRHGRLVILGDPGSGKTTLARWLTRQLARAVAAGEARARVPLCWVDPRVSENDLTPFELGPTRVPVLVRVADFASWQQQSADPSLEAFLGFQPWLVSRGSSEHPAGHDGEPIPQARLNAVLRALLATGGLTVILDGLDEITEGGQRADVVATIDRFADTWCLASVGAGAQNRLVVTSRIAGYHASPLQAESAHLTIEPMEGEVVARFCRVWALTVYTQLAGPEESPRVVARRAAEAAASLYEAIHDPARPGVRELASNPLLLNILAIAHKNSGRSLPGQRVLLYEQAVNTLLEVWRPKQRDDYLGTTTVKAVLTALAVHIHRTYATGLIEERELYEQVSGELERIYQTPRAQRERRYASQVETFIRLVRNHTGILAERGEYLYGFLHLTFQEYFAALYFSGSARKIKERIEERIDDPRWREPILLALGAYAAKSDIDSLEELLAELLAGGAQGADELAMLQRGILLAQALPDMDHPPRAVKLVVRHLLATIARQGLPDLTALALTQIEPTLVALRRGAHAQLVDDVLIDLLNDLGAPASVAVAALAARRLGWYTPDIYHALLAAQAADAPAWGWPVATALRAALAERHHDELRPVLDAAVPARAALRAHQPRLAAEGRAWERVMAALHGGYGDLAAHHSEREYRTIASFLNLIDDARSPFEEFYRARWAGPDTVYNMAVFLDTTGRQQKRTWDVAPHFDPDLAYRDSPLAPALHAGLAEGWPAADLATRLRDVWDDAGAAPAVRAEALVALVALGADMVATLRTGLADPGYAGAATLALEQLGRLRHALCDPLARAVNTLDEAALAALDPPHWVAVVRAAHEVAARYGARPRRAPEQRPDGLDLHQRADLLAEDWAFWFSGAGDTSGDRVYNVAVVLDTLGRRLAAAQDELVLAFGRAAQAANNRWPLHPGWQTEALPPYRHDPDDLPHEVLTALEQIDPELAFVRNWFLTALRPLVARQPALLAEIVVFTLGDTDPAGDPLNTLQSLAPDVLAQGNLPAMALELARSVGEPYLRARALARLARYSPGQHDALLAEAWEAARAVDDPLRRGRALEAVGARLGTAERAALADELRLAAEAIVDPDEQARALGRLCWYVGPAERPAALAQALDAVARIPDEGRRAETLALLREQLIWPALAARAEAIGASLEDPWHRARALGRAAPPLLAALPLIDAGAAASWAVIALAAAVDDACAACAPLHVADQAWASLGGPLADEAYAQLLATSDNRGLRLSRRAVLALDEQGAASPERAAALLALCAAPPPETLPVLSGWLADERAAVRDVAALIVAEHEGLSERTIGGLLACLTAESDWLRQRAARRLHSDRTTSDRDERRLRSSTLGLGALLTLARAVDEASPQLNLTIQYLWTDLIVDDAETILAAARQIDEGGPDAAPAALVLRWVEKLTPAAWPGVVRALREGSGPTVDALLESLARLATLDKLDAAARADVQALLGELRAAELEALRFLPDAPAQIIEAARAALRFREAYPASDPATALEIADTHIVSQTISLAAAAGLGGDHTNLVAGLQELGKTLYFPNKGFPREVEAAAKAVAETPRLLEILVGWLPRVLGRMAAQDDPAPLWARRLRTDLLAVISAAAEQHLPAAFASLAPEGTERLLVDVVRHSDARVARQSAIALLSRLSHVTPAYFLAVPHALNDVRLVRQSTFESVQRLRSIEGEPLTYFAEGIQHPVPLVAYAYAQLLAAWSTNPRTAPAQRHQALRLLARAIHQPHARRHVVPWYVPVPVPELPRLSQVFYQTLLQIGGQASAGRQPLPQAAPKEGP